MFRISEHKSAGSLIRGCFLAIGIIFPLFAQSARNPAAAFHFTPVDEKLLVQANEVDAKLAREGLVYRDESAERYLETIAGRLLAAHPAPERVNFRFSIVRDPMVNAFSLPNGSIYVNTGLIAALRNEAELASVLSHEITHVTERHAYLENRSVRRKNLALDVLLGAAAAGGIRGGAVFGQSIWATAQVSQLFLVASMYGYSRELERDADGGGYNLLVRAGYEGKAMVDAFEILDEKIEMEPTQPFWRTHPKLRERIAEAKSLTLRGSADHPRASEEKDYLEHLAPVIRFNIELDLESRRARTAVDRAQRLVDWTAAPNDITLLGDAYSSLGAKRALPAQDDLTPEAKKQNRNRILKRTAEEEQRDLAALPGGQETLAKNRARAESLYRQAIQKAPQLPEPHRGLGMLYEDESKDADALAEYTQYLTLAPPGAMDRLRIERRLVKLQNGTATK